MTATTTSVDERVDARIGRDSLTDRVVVVTGSSAGIGAALAQQLQSAGALVVGVDREAPSVEGVDPLAADLSDPRATAAVVPAVLERHGRLDALVNNAGLARHAAVTDIDLADLGLMWEVNGRAVVQLTRDALRAMAVPPYGTGAGGRVVNVISSAALAGGAGESAYCATKFAVRGFTEAAAEEGRLLGVRVSGLYPAGVATGFWDLAVADRATFTGDKEWLSPAAVADTVLALLRLPVDVDVPSLVVRHPGDADLVAIAAKLNAIKGSR